METKTLDKQAIWLSDWVLEDGKRVTRTVVDIIVKGDNEESILNCPKMQKRVFKKIRGKAKKLTAKSVTLVSQHGYGPREY